MDELLAITRKLAGDYAYELTEGADQVARSPDSPSGEGRGPAMRERIE